MEKLVSENEEIKALKQKIQQGYLNKERAKQLAEKQVRRVDELVCYLSNIGKWGRVWSWNDQKEGKRRKADVVGRSSEAKRAIWSKKCFEKADGLKGWKGKRSLWTVLERKRTGWKSNANTDR